MEIPNGKGVLKAKILETKYETKLEFLRQRGVQKKPSMGGGGGEYGYFLDLNNWFFPDFT